MLRDAGRLPPIRLILRPNIGFGVEVKVNFGAGLNCFAAAEAYLNGASHVAFGLEPRRASWFRLQLAPALQISLRVPFFRITRLKRLHVGAVANVAHNGRFAAFDVTSRRTFTDSLRTIIQSSVEIHHRPTLIDALFDQRQLEQLRKSIEELRAAREQEREQLRRDRVASGRAFDRLPAPGLDPRLNEIPRYRIPSVPDGPRSGLPRVPLSE